jgi:hypothetical protein
VEGGHQEVQGHPEEEEVGVAHQVHRQAVVEAVVVVQAHRVEVEVEVGVARTGPGRR